MFPDTEPNRSPLHIGDRASEFEAASTHGTVRLEDIQGHWLMFFSHPANFTPV